jgi:hypothetical protein
MGDWLKRISAIAAGRLVAWLIISAITATGWGVALVASWKYLQTAPWPVLVLSCVGLAALLGVVGLLVVVVLFSPIRPGTYGSKYLFWYMVPIRKLSWNFAQFLGGTSGDGQPVLIHCFQVQFKVNRGEGIVPRRAFIECKVTGAFQDVLLSPQNTYVKAEEISFVPRGHWFSCQAQFGSVTKELFLRQFDGFEFVFEYDDRVFSRRFSRRELEWWIDGFWRFSNTRPEPRGVLRTG